MAEKCFCHFNGYQVKDAAARKSAAENATAIEAEAAARTAALAAEAAARTAALAAEAKDRAEAIEEESRARAEAIEEEATARSAAIAAEAAARTAALAGIQVDQMKLVWENASPTSDFAAQTVEINLTGFDFVIIEFRATGGSSSHVYEWCKVGKQTVLQSPANVTSSGSYMTWMMRTAKATTTGVQFATGYSKALSEMNSEATAARIIPTKIYGVRGLE